MKSSTMVRQAQRQPIDWGQRIRSRLWSWLSLLLLCIMSVIMLAPIVWTFSTSLREPVGSFSVPPRWIPIPPVVTNYREVFSSVPGGTYVLNSVIVTFATVAGQLFTAALAGYAFARFQFPLKNVLFWLILATLMIPAQATIIPVFILISRLGLTDNLMSLILPSWATAFGTFLLRQYFMTISNEFEEAALMDGASQWRIYWSVYLPLVAPGLAILAILSFNSTWNEFFRPLIFLNSPEHFTLPLGLVNLAGYMGTGSISVVLAGVILSLIPVLIIFLFGQRYLIEGITMGGVKG
ncbi:MAG TPA: carbohydrate ABC transporter permease [Roseiflexaceae bacterium]|nr:carbohydrate ABC transporter permease [Roseiflexaceae bacterium]